MEQERLSLTPDEQAIFTAHLPVVDEELRRLARVWRRHYRTFGPDDLHQCGCEAMVAGIITWRTFGPQHPNISLRAFLAMRIMRAMQEFAAENRHLLTVRKSFWSALSGKGMSEDTRRKLLKTRRAGFASWEMDKRAGSDPDHTPIDLHASHSDEWLQLRDRVHAAVLTAVSELSGLERAVAEALANERLSVSNARLQTERGEIGRRFGMTAMAVMMLEYRLMTRSKYVLIGKLPRNTNTPRAIATARRVLGKIDDAAGCLVAFVAGYFTGPEALPAVTIAAGRIMAPAAARLTAGELAGLLGLPVPTIQHIEAKIIRQTARLGVAA